MATDVTVRVEGAKELRAALRRAGGDLRDLRTVNMRAATIAANAARGGAPVRTGRLAASVRPGATQTRGSVRAGGARVPYANAIHWGWHRRGIRPNPWITRAAQRTEPAWTRVYRSAIDELLRKVGRST